MPPKRRIKKTGSSKHPYILPLGLMLIIVMMTLTSHYTASNTRVISSQLIQTVKQNNTNTRLLRVMSQAIINRSAVLVEMLQQKDPFALDTLFLKFNQIATDYVVAETQLENLSGNDPQLKKLLDNLKPAIQSNGRFQNTVYDLIYQDKTKEALILFVTEVMPRQKAALEKIQEMENSQFTSDQNQLSHTEKKTSNVYNSLLTFNVLAILASLLITVFIVIKQRKSDKNLEKLANTDELTQLPNRAFFINTLDKEVNRPTQQFFTVAFFDIDHFKTINDNYGHQVGDKIIQAFARQVIETLDPEIDVLSRLGGDEFVLMLRSIKTKTEVETYISKLSKSLDTSFFIDGNEIFVSTSIGVSFFDSTVTDADELLKNADIAMYEAKIMGKNCYQFFSKEASDKLEQKHATCHALQTVLKDKNDDRQLSLKYQPLHNIETGTITECEALIRWVNARGETISPDEFIPLAEKSNLIKKVNRFVVDEACKQQYEWKKSGINNIRININLSGNKVIFDTLLKQFKRNLKKYDLSPTDFGIELTERTLHQVSTDTINKLDEIRRQGMKISIDDFGTGYSSLSYLKKLPITTLKIDKGFIDDLPQDKDDQALVKAIISLGHALNLDIVAEGVETAAQLKFLQENACNIAQGYYLHHPLDSEQLSQLPFVA